MRSQIAHGLIVHSQVVRSHIVRRMLCLFNSADGRREEKKQLNRDDLQEKLDQAELVLVGIG